MENRFPSCGESIFYNALLVSDLAARLKYIYSRIPSVKAFST